MPAKSKRGKGKRPQNRNRARQPIAPSAVDAAGTAAPAAASPAVNISSVPTRSPKSAAAKANAKTLVYSGATAEQYPFFISELKRIGVLTAVILVVLIVLSLVLN